ncbi:vanomycin resistance protein VanB [Haloechinothrix sp. LS1_15]|nr:vanomycin resistance protein VanB [Haloechinothrix sp. LS1_15]
MSAVPPDLPGHRHPGHGAQGDRDDQETTTFAAITGHDTDRGVDDRATDAFAAVPADPPIAQTSQFTAFGAHQAAGSGDGGDGGDGGDLGEEAPDGTGRLRKPLLAAGGVLAALGLIYGADVLLSAGDVPRGVTVAGVSVGGMSEEAAEDKLQSELGPRLSEPVDITAGAVESELDPQAAGLSVDWGETLEQAGRQPLNPFTRVASFFTTREVGVVGNAEDDRLLAAIDELADEELNRETEEGDIEFEPIPNTDGEVEAIAVAPRAGQELVDLEAAGETVRTSWLDEEGVELEVTTEPVMVSEEGVQRALESVAEPAVSAPVVFEGDGADARLRPVEIGEALEFEPQEDGSLEASADEEALTEALQPQLADTEEEGRDAEIVFSGGEPTVEPSKEGVVIDWEPTLEPFMDVVVTANDRTIEVIYTDDEPEVTTEEAEALGIDEVIGEFTTEDFAEDSGVNIRRVAEQVDGAIVKPGETFRLNQHTGPRTASQGYVEAGIIEDGLPGRAVGGGISQFATTLYNAAYFAGMQDAGHTPHSYYISRYPPAREATVFQAAGGGIDLAFTNDADTGVAIQTHWTPSSITVRIWGTKRYEVESVTGDRTNVVEPSVRRVDDDDCVPSSGIEGFTITDTRILRDADTGEVVRREPQTVTYNPKPEIVCEDGD